MIEERKHLNLLLVDDEEDFRRVTSSVLGRRGFEVTEAANGDDALDAVRDEHFDIVLLDLKMPGKSGIETLKELRKIKPNLPVIILTGHGDFEAAVTTIKLDIVDFLQKPVDIDLLANRIHDLIRLGIESGPLREQTISELMVPPSVYPRINVDEPLENVLSALKKSFTPPEPHVAQPGEIRSALVYDSNDKFLGIIRFNDLLKLLLPPYLGDSPYATYFTGMFLAQCKVLGSRRIEELVGDPIVVEADAPIMEAIHLMVDNRLINLPVVKSGQLVGILRGRDVVLEVARSMGSMR
ncbi:MAG: response regulator [candidate division Zixibacteria bacterium]|nr:response regulator [candidate division Zixibacteria bacterium]MBU1469909.1 response regulator [candidate division Zixibacteria bacterium]MBU2624004.1 response regulator [candidate division Zixibacteria bacterium]